MKSDAIVIATKYTCSDGTIDGQCSTKKVGYECYATSSVNQLVQNTAKCGGATTSGSTATDWVSPPTVDSSIDNQNAFWQQEQSLNSGGACTIPQTVKCDDGSVRILYDCIGGILKSTGQSCPGGSRPDCLLGTLGACTPTTLADGSIDPVVRLPIIPSNITIGKTTLPIIAGKGSISVLGLVIVGAGLVGLVWSGVWIFLVPVGLGLVWIGLKYFGVA